ncbi:Ribosomal RNA-processing protein 7 (RRP7) domain containing protein [Rhypophila sp. PSN 637]
MSPIPVTIGDFSILPVTIPPLPSFPKSAVHYIYVRRNEPKVPTADDTRRVFLTNIPVDSTELHLRSLFASLVGAGRFESVTFSDERSQDSESAADAAPLHAVRLLTAHGNKKRKRDDAEAAAERAREEEAAALPKTWTRTLHPTGSTAVVQLADKKSVEQVLRAIAKVHKNKKYPSWPSPENVPKLGSTWLKAHNVLSYPSKDTIQTAIDNFSTMFAKREQEAAEIAKRLRNEPDEDGFVTVTKGASRTTPASRIEAEEARKKMLERQEKKKLELANFYAFQIRERKKEEQAELLKKIEEDRQKVFEMRAKRGRFVPES